MLFMILSPLLPAAPLAGRSMTSPVLFVLSLALVCSVFGLTSEQAADHDTKTRSKMRIPDYDLKINNHWTNKINRNYINYNENIDEVKLETNKGDDIQARHLDYHISNIRMRNTRVRKFDPSTTFDTRSKSKMIIPEYNWNKNNHWTNKNNRKYINYNENLDKVKPETDKGDDIQARNLDYHISFVRMRDTRLMKFDPNSLEVKSPAFDTRPKSKIVMLDYDLNIENNWTNKINRKYNNFKEDLDEIKHNTNKSDDIQARNLDYHISNTRMKESRIKKYDPSSLAIKSRVKRDDMDAKCESFKFDDKEMIVTHPHSKNTGNNNYYNNTDCIIKINATTIDQVIQLTFVEIFSIEYHPQCCNDYLEIRDGYFGYADLMGKFCGQEFPRTLTTKGPNVWLKFHSDKSIENEGFKIIVEFKAGPSRYVPESCYITFKREKWGMISKKRIDRSCTDNSLLALDVLWTIIVPVDMKIYLNFTDYSLAKPNDCYHNVIQVFESKDQEMDVKLAEYCGSVANPVTTMSEKSGNIMYVRMYATKEARENTTFNATFNAYRRLASIDESCHEDEFDCEDSTCIDIHLACDNIAHCRLKTDEDSSRCTVMAVSTLHQTNILAIFIVFTLILSGIMSVIIFKFIWKIYKDQKLIKEHVRQSCEDRLESLAGSRMILDPKRLQRDSEPRASLERENHNNEMVKKQRSFPTKHLLLPATSYADPVAYASDNGVVKIENLKSLMSNSKSPEIGKQRDARDDSRRSRSFIFQSSIESDFRDAHLDLEVEIWRREVISIEEDTSIERNGRTRKSDFSKKEESMRSRAKESGDVKEKKEKEHNREIKDDVEGVSVGVADTTESGCQTRDSLFQTDPPPSSEGSGSNSQGLSTFGFSGNTIVRISPPAIKNTSEIKIELMKPKPQHQESKAQKRIDRRPISNDTTRSAPDVIIVSKPIL